MGVKLESLALKKENRLTIFENVVLRNMFRPKGGAVTE
jgi:hypothetical protein